MPELSWPRILKVAVFWTLITGILQSSHHKSISAEYYRLINCRKVGVFIKIQGDLNG